MLREVTSGREHEGGNTGNTPRARGLTYFIERIENIDYKIKKNEIKKKDFLLYVIKDFGRYDKNFVRKQFVKFLKWTNKNI